MGILSTALQWARNKSETARNWFTVLSTSLKSWSNDKFLVAWYCRLKFTQPWCPENCWLAFHLLSGYLPSGEQNRRFLSQAAIQHIGHPCRLNEEKSIKKLGKLMEAMGATRGPPIGPIREALRLRSFSHRPQANCQRDLLIVIFLNVLLYWICLK